MKNVSKLFLFSFAILTLTSSTFAADRNLPWITIIPRSQRWANEALRYSSMSKTERDKINAQKNEIKMNELRESDNDKYWAIKEEEYKVQAANEYLKEHYYSEIDLDWTKYESDGTYLSRPEYIKNNKTKIIVHHTASDNTILKNKQDVLDYMSGVYRYHTITNGRWDIGYNFLIDPFGNIYEGRAGGEWVVWAHAKWNNTPSVGISLIWNFENVQPTKEALDALVRLSAALAKKYNIDPFTRTDYHKDSKENPYIVSSQNYVIAGHKDAGITACPGKYLYQQLPYVRDWVKALLEWKTLTSASGIKSVYETVNKPNSNTSTSAPKTKLTYDYFQSTQSKIAPAVRAIKNDYINKNNISFASNSMSKLQSKVSLSQAKNYLQQEINVFLYDLTQNYSQYQISCDWWCAFTFSNNKINSTNALVQISDKIELVLQWKTYEIDRLLVSSQGSTVSIDNYDRKSYAGIPWNKFHGELVFKKDFMKDLNGVEYYKPLVINKLNFQDYMKWIAETNDTESATKNEVMAMISKSYALFYMDPQNIHPNIPVRATYQAVDDARIFQKYVWAWLEQTLTKRYQALNKTKDKIALYDGNVVLLPYFSCSAGFTYSAKEKRGRNDTPYLQSKFDLWICQSKEFEWHGVGLSGLWAERWAKFGRSYSDIIRYYYPGITITNL